MQVDYEITPEGLVFTADVEERWEIQDLIDEGRNYYTTAGEIFEYATCNGLSWVDPEDIGALTNSLIFSDEPVQDNGTYAETAQFFWFPNYMVSDPLEVLMNTGKVIFTKAE